MPANASALVVAKATFENVQRLAFPFDMPEANWKASKDKSLTDVDPATVAVFVVDPLS